MTISTEPLRDPGSGAAAEMSDQDFRRVAELVRNITGIQLPDHKRTLARSRLSKRLASLGIPSFVDYLDLLESGRSEDELTEFCNALTTNLTSFFREPHHFEHLSKELDARPPGPSLRIWSAGCSSGEETYSIAMTLLSNANAATIADKRILATDIDTNVLERARNASYPADKVSGIPDNHRREYLTRQDNGDF